MTWVASHSPSDAALVRSLLEPRLVAEWQNDSGPGSTTSKTLVKVWRKRNHVIAAGSPPLRRSVVDAYLSMFAFISKESGKMVPAAVADRAAFTSHVSVQTLWLALQDMWATSTPAQKQALRAQWRGGSPPVARSVPRAAPAAKSGGGSAGATAGLAHDFEEHLSVANMSQSYMMRWGNPFSP